MLSDLGRGVMKIPLFKKFLLMPRNLSWWVWLVTALCLTAGLMGYSSGFYAAVTISLIQTVIYNLKEKSALTFPVQVRFAYTGLLILCQIPILWLAVLGASGRNICARSLRILFDGPDSLAPAGEPHGANKPGSDPADVSDAARAGQRPSWTPLSRLPRRRVRSRRPYCNSFRPDKRSKLNLTKPTNQPKL